MKIDRRWLSRLAVGPRLVLTVALAMAVVLALTATVVFWRVQSGLDQQLGRDSSALHSIVVQDVKTGGKLPDEGPGLWYQIFEPDGTVRTQSGELPVSRLLDRADLQSALAGTVVREQRDALFHPGGRSYVVVATSTGSSSGRVVVATAVSRAHRDEVLRELLLQLVIADVLVLVAASYVGYRTARGALNPVEQYRRAADAAGGRPGVRLPVATDRDDELTRLGHTLNDLLSRLEASAVREHQFLADTSHELRTPLALLKAEIDFALNRPRTPDQLVSTLNSVQAQTDRLIDLANALLELEEIDSGPDMTRVAVDVPVLVETVSQRYAAAFAQSGRTVNTDVSEATVLASERWLEAALSNLLSNALRHGEGDVLVEARTRGDWLRLSVTDEGPGFPDDFVDKAFDRFARAEESRSKAGSGLGLALVAAIARLHEGSVHIRKDSPGASVVVDIVCPPATRRGLRLQQTPVP